jgi:hypothetical protein
MGSKVHLEERVRRSSIGHPSTLRSQGNTNRANTLMREDRRITVSEVAAMLDVSSGSACVTVVCISLYLWLVQELPLLLELSM